MCQECPTLFGSHCRLLDKIANYHRGRTNGTPLAPLYTRTLHEVSYCFLLVELKHGALLHIKEISKVIKGLLSGEPY